MSRRSFGTIRAAGAACAAALAVAFVAAGVACEAQVPTLPPPLPNAVEVTIRTEPPGGSVFVDGIPVGPSPATVKLNPGPHRIKASMSGYYPLQDQKIHVGQGSPREHLLTLIASH